MITDFYSLPFIQFGLFYNKMQLLPRVALVFFNLDPIFPRSVSVTNEIGPILTKSGKTGYGEKLMGNCGHLE